MNTHLINREGREGIAILRLSPSIIDCVLVVQFENAASTFLIYASKELEGVDYSGGQRICIRVVH